MQPARRPRTTAQCTRQSPGAPVAWFATIAAFSRLLACKMRSSSWEMIYAVCRIPALFALVGIKPAPCCAGQVETRQYIWLRRILEKENIFFWKKQTQVYFLFLHATIHIPVMFRKSLCRIWMNGELIDSYTSCSHFMECWKDLLLQMFKLIQTSMCQWIFHLIQNSNC